MAPEGTWGMLGRLRNSIASLQASKQAAHTQASNIFCSDAERATTHLRGQHHAHILPAVQQRHGLEEEVGVGHLGRGMWGCLGWVDDLSGSEAGKAGIRCHTRKPAAAWEAGQQAGRRTMDQHKTNSHIRTWSASNTQSTSVSGMSWPAG